MESDQVLQNRCLKDEQVMFDVTVKSIICGTRLILDGPRASHRVLQQDADAVSEKSWSLNPMQFHHQVVQSHYRQDGQFS